MLTGYSQFKEVIVSADRNDNIKEKIFINNRKEIESYIEAHKFDPVISIYSTNLDILTDDLFNEGFDFALVSNFGEYLNQGNCKKFVKFYHHENKINLIWSTRKKFIIKDDIHTNLPIRKWMVDMFNFKKKGA